VTAPFGTRGAAHSTLTAVLFKVTTSGGKTPSGSATQRESHSKSPRRAQRTVAHMKTYSHNDITPVLWKSSRFVSLTSAQTQDAAWGKLEVLMKSAVVSKRVIQ